MADASVERASQIARTLPHLRRAQVALGKLLDVARPEACTDWATIRDVGPISAQVTSVARFAYFGGVRGPFHASGEAVDRIALKLRLLGALATLHLSGARVDIATSPDPELSRASRTPVEWARCISKYANELDSAVGAVLETERTT